MDKHRPNGVAIVTGAGSGVGRAIALHLSGLGYRVVLVGRRRGALEETQGDAHSQTHIVVADLALQKDRARVIQSTLNAFGRIDVLVNNAGAAELVLLADASDEQIRSAFEINAIAPVELASRALRTMKTQGCGCVVNISSYSTLDPFAGLGMYGCSKGAMNVLARAIVNEYGDDGIRGYTIALGAAETEMLRSMFDESVLPSSATVSPDQVATLVCALVDDSGAERNGQLICFPPRDEP